MSRASRAEVRALRSQMREWRRGRADTTVGEVLSEAYIAVFAVCMLGAMAISAIVQTRDSFTAACTTTSCEDARSTMAWVAALGVLAVTLAAARTVGPVMVSPAVGSWLLTAPLDRAPLLRPRLLATTVVTTLGAALISAVASVLAGFGVTTIVVFTAAVAVTATCALMFAAVWQPHGGGATRLAGWVMAAAAWLGLVSIAGSAEPGALDASGWHPQAGVAAIVLLGALSALLLVRALAALSRVRRDQLTPGGSLLASLSGALAGLDLALMYDVLIGRRWLRVSTVRPVRGGPGGAWALVWRDIVRLRRSASSLVILIAAAVVPYVAAALDLGEVVPLIGGLTAFGAGLALCSALRTSSRTPGLVRCFPMSAAVVRTACLAVPGALLVIWALAAAPALHRAMEPITWPDAAAVAVAMGLAGICAIARWLLASPPDYSRPLVSSPAGAIPTGLFGSLLRGFDVLILVIAPVLFAPSLIGAEVSVVLATIVLAVLLNRR